MRFLISFLLFFALVFFQNSHAAPAAVAPGTSEKIYTGDINQTQDRDVNDFSDDDRRRLQEDLESAQKGGRYAAGRGFKKRVDRLAAALKASFKTRPMDLAPATFQPTSFYGTSENYIENINAVRAEDVAGLSEADLRRLQDDICTSKKSSNYEKNDRIKKRVSRLQEALKVAFKRRGLSAGATKVMVTAQTAKRMVVWDDIKGPLEIMKTAPTQSFSHVKDPQAQQKRIQTFRENIKLAETTYPYQKAFFVYDHTRPLTFPSATFKTVFSVVNGDTIDVSFEHVIRSKKTNWSVLDMANAYSAGGLPSQGTGAQEEQLCYRSNIICPLAAARAHVARSDAPFIEEFGTIYMPDVTIFRTSEVFADPDLSFAMMSPGQLNFIASAAYNRKPGRRGFGPFDQKTYEDNTLEKIRSQLRTALHHGDTNIVLSAFGCGAFNNDNRLIATLYKRALAEPEFLGQFEEVVFAIKDRPNPGPRANVRVFEDVFQDLL